MEGLSQMTIHGVWYRSEPMLVVSLAEAFNRDRGRLRIENNQVEFTSKNNHFIIRKILKVSYGLAGGKGLNAWVHIEFEENGQTREAFFADGKLLGYYGVLGGTKKILNQVANLLPNPRPIDIDKSYVQVQKRFFAILTIAILMLLNRFVCH